ncbi:MAG: hypothetical protein AAF975_08295, partial [Spirochaetota bacterium]
ARAPIIALQVRQHYARWEQCTVDCNALGGLRVWPEKGADATERGQIEGPSEAPKKTLMLPIRL